MRSRCILCAGKSGRRCYQYGKQKSKFLSLRPGLTGYWASHGRSNTTYKERIKMELYYIDHCGILLDLKIMFKTFIAVFKKDGAK